jgi:feruloyl esterase
MKLNLFTAWLTCSLPLVAADANLLPRSFESKCAALPKTLKLANTTVWFSQVVKAGTNLTFPDNDPSCTRPAQVIPADICRVAMRVTTSNRSEISMEAWLPSNWTGRFLSTGNGGLSGCIQYEDMAYTSGLGFSTVGANNGHNGTSGEAFYNNPDVVADFAYRSIHTNVVIGKQVSASFYGQKHKKSYYLGCSTGGRQGMKSAQDFPEDFDGIVVGAPAVAFNNLSSWSGSFLLETGPPDSPTFVPFEKWPAIHDDVLAQCDGIDGYKDGIIEDPQLCDYRPESLLCAPGTPSNSTTCLTGPQAATVRAIFSPLYGENGTLVFPRMQPGSESLGAPQIYYNGQPFPYTSDWYRYAIYNDPTFDVSKLTTRDYAYAHAKNPSNIETWKGDLSSYQKRGGKLLHYHGQQDQIITSENSPRYYNHVARTMQLPSSSLDEFYRFFRISGMGHCSGGPGAFFIGNLGSANAGLSPDRNVLTAMVQWVEQGTAPDSILGTKYVNDTVSLGVEFSRRHCKYPLRNVYLGGDATTPAAWKCIV